MSTLLTILCICTISWALTPLERKENFLINNGLLNFFWGTDKSELSNHFEIKGEKVFMFTSAEDKTAEVYQFPDRRKSEFSPTAATPLNGVRIAIDPGHIGGEFSVLEGRNLKLKGHLGVLKEGDVTLKTAIEIARQLRKLGASVLLTREKNTTEHLPMQLDQWIATTYPEKEISTEERSHIFYHEYLKYDRSYRAQLINNFSPDLTFIVHYDAHGAGRGKVAIPTEINYNFSYVPGNFMAGELSDTESRKEFYRLATSNDIEASLKLCTLLNRELSKSTGVRIRTTWDGGTWSLKREWYASDPWWSQFIPSRATGVYSRNLHLTRLIRGPLCYGESLVQNNPKEFDRLVGQAEIRTKQVANGYVNAALKYLSSVQLPVLENKQ